MSSKMRVALVALVLWVLPVTGALAQETGGSFGGGDFSSGGGSDNSGGGGSWGGGGGGTDWGGSSGGFTSGGSSYSGGGSLGCCGTVGVLLLIGVVMVISIVARNRARRAMGGMGMPNMMGGGGPAQVPYAAPGTMHVSAISLGVDWRARAELQQMLQRLAASGKTGTPNGRAELLRETVVGLRRAEIAWLYAGYREQGGLAPSQAESVFQGAAGDYRARFRKELVRAADGSLVEQESPEMRARREEGKGTVVVTLVVASRRPLAGVQNVANANEIRQALQDRASLGGQQLVALEVIWSPAAENDRMSTAELEQNYQELRMIDPTSIAGRVFCQYCSAPFAMELGKCPHCGGPAPRQGPGSQTPA